MKRFTCDQPRPAMLVSTKFRHSIMYALPIVLLLMLDVGAPSAQAQAPTCDTLTLSLTSHGHGGITVSRVWVDDPDVFSVTADRPIPFEASEGETFYIRVCILRADGQTYSTVAHYETNHGSEAENVTLVAPNPTAAFNLVDETRRPRTSVAPSIAKGRILIQFARVESIPILIRLVDNAGRIVKSRELSELPSRAISFDVRDVCAGPYHLSIQVAGATIGVHRVIVVP